MIGEHPSLVETESFLGLLDAVSTVARYNGSECLGDSIDRDGSIPKPGRECQRSWRTLNARAKIARSLSSARNEAQGEQKGEHYPPLQCEKPSLRWAKSDSCESKIFFSDSEEDDWT